MGIMAVNPPVFIPLKSSDTRHVGSVFAFLLVLNLSVTFHVFCLSKWTYPSSWEEPLFTNDNWASSNATGSGSP